MNAKESQRSLLSAINLLAADGRLSAIEELQINEAKTKEIASIVKTAELQGQNIVFVVEKKILN